MMADDRRTSKLGKSSSSLLSVEGAVQRSPGSRRGGVEMPLLTVEAVEGIEDREATSAEGSAGSG